MFNKCEFTSLICCWFISIGGWKGFICFLENIIDSDLEGLNETSHLVAHRCILARSELSWSAARRGSFIYTKNRRGPKIEPCGTSAFRDVQPETGKTTLCLLLSR